MLNVPVESLTDLKTCSTEIIVEFDDIEDTEPVDVDEISTPLETKGSDMTALSENFKTPAPHFNKLAHAAGKLLVKPFAALLVAAALVPAGSMPAHAQSAAQTILVVGDSLSAEYGLKRGTGWVPLLEKQLAEEKKAVKVVNASISGDTTSGGNSRLAALLSKHQPSIVVLELGGNDALRGLPLDMTEKNLTTMTQASKKAGAKVLLVGMQVPPNYGSAYTANFTALFAKVAKAEKVSLVPFFLKGIADSPDSTAQFQADRIHPNEQSQPIMLANVWPELKKLIR